MNAGPIGGGNTAPGKVKFDRLVAYSTLQLPLAMAALPVVLNVSHFYGEILKLSLQIMGPIFIFARVVDAIQDPVIGLISDRFTRRGKRGRLAFVALMTPVLAGGFYMLFDPPAAWYGNQTMMAVWLVAALLLVHLGYSGVSISYHSHGAELTDDYNERTKVTVGREVFGLLGMTFAVVLPTWLTFRLGDADGYMMLGLVFLPIVAAVQHADALVGRPVRSSAGHPCRTQCFRRVLRAAQEPPVPPPAACLRRQRRGAGRRGDGDAVLCRARAEGRQAAGRHHPAHLFHRRRGQRAAVAAAVQATEQGRRLVRRHRDDRHRHVRARCSSAPGDFYWFLAISVITGLGLGADYGLPPSILADVINSPESGDTQGKTGTYFGLWALATKLATAIGAAGSLPVAAMLGFNPAKGLYGTTALIIAYIVLPVLIKIVAATLIWFIRIEAQRCSVKDELWGAG